jgi:hypothetical protein
VFLASGVSLPIFYFEAISERPFATAIASMAVVVAQLVVSAIGVWRCYLANGGRAGHRFAERFIALAWVVGVRLFFAVAPLFILLFALEIELQTPCVEGALVVVTVIYFWRVWFHITWVATHAESAA